MLILTAYRQPVTDLLTKIFDVFAKVKHYYQAAQQYFMIKYDLQFNIVPILIA